MWQPRSCGSSGPERPCPTPRTAPPAALRWSPYEERCILDHSSDEISTEEAAVLIEALKEGIGREGYEFHVGTSYRHLLIEKEGKVIELTPPHDILTKRIGSYLPNDEVLLEMMKKSYDILKNHPLNIKRKEKGLKPANSAWFWGAGKKPALTSFEERTGRKGVMTTEQTSCG